MRQQSFSLVCLELKVQCTMSQEWKISVQTRVSDESPMMLTIGLEYAHVGCSLRTFSYFRFFEAAINDLFWEMESEEEKYEPFSLLSDPE